MTYSRGVSFVSISPNSLGLMNLDDSTTMEGDGDRTVANYRQRAKQLTQKLSLP